MWVVPMSSIKSDPEVYFDDHVIDKVPSRANGHCGFEPFRRALGINEGELRKLLKDYANSGEGFKILNGLSQEQFDAVVARLVPEGGITKEFLKNCGPQYYMCDAHLALLAGLFYLVIPCVSKLGERHSQTYVPHQEQPGRQLGFVGLQHDGIVHDDGATMNPKAPLPPSGQAFRATRPLASVGLLSIIRWCITG